MVWASKREKELGIHFGFIIRGDGREGRVLNLSFAEKDTAHNSPISTSVRPASGTEVKLWRGLLRQL
jgi:hypothetical protein